MPQTKHDIFTKAGTESNKKIKKERKVKKKYFFNMTFSQEQGQKPNKKIKKGER